MRTPQYRKVAHALTGLILLAHPLDVALAEYSFPEYNVMSICTSQARDVGKSVPECQATEHAFAWALRSIWRVAKDVDRAQLETCLDAIEATWPDTGSYSALAECAASVSYVNE